MGIGSVAGSYANFIFGTGQETVSNAISNAIKNRGTAGQSYVGSLISGTKKGLTDSYNGMKASGGYWKAIKGDLSAMWQGLKKGKISALGKGFPLLMSALWVASEAGNIIGATKDEGIVGGLKETGRTAATMTLGTLFSSIAQGMCKAKGKGGIWGLVATIGGYTLGAMLSGKLFGKSHAERKAEAEAQAQAQGQYQDPTQTAMYNPGADPNQRTYIPDESAFMPNYVNTTAQGQQAPYVPEFPPVQTVPGSGPNNIISKFNPAFMGMGGMTSPMMNMPMMGLGGMGMPMMGMGMMGMPMMNTIGGMGGANGNLLMN